MATRRAAPIVLAFLLLAVPPAHGDDAPSASGLSKGHQMTQVSALAGPNGFSGHIFLSFRDQRANFTENKVHATVTCLTVGPATFDGLGTPVVAEQAASILGVVDRSTNPFILVGQEIEVEIADLGTAAPGHDFGPDWTGTIVEDPLPEPQWFQGENDEPDCTFNARDHHRVVDGNYEIEGQS